jgi:aminoglycoside 3-N-acetyltransferase I
MTTTRRLRPGDEDQARELFAMMAEAFGEAAEPLADEYVAQLLGSGSFWAVAALESDRVVGGITAHTLPMTRAQAAELFVYDLAVHEDFRRRGLGGLLVGTLRAEAALAGIGAVFVAADEEDAHALAFYRSLAGSESPGAFFAWETPDRR